MKVNQQLKDIQGQAVAEAEPAAFFYSGFPTTGTTAVPNDFFDTLAPQLSEAELRVLLYIIRRTCGFHKQADAISLNQLMHGITNHKGRVLDAGTGLSKPGVLKGIRGLIEKGVITQENDPAKTARTDANSYKLCFSDNISQPTQHSKAEYYGYEVETTKAEGGKLGSTSNSKPELPGKPALLPAETKLTTPGQLSALKVVNEVDPHIHRKQNYKVQKDSNNNTHSAVVGSLALLSQVQPQLELGNQLAEFGINPKTVEYLLGNYASEYIAKKIELVRHCLKKPGNATQNPAGFLRRAIEEDYQPTNPTVVASYQPKNFPATEAFLRRSQPEIARPSRYRKHPVANRRQSGVSVETVKVSSSETKFTPTASKPGLPGKLNLPRHNLASSNASKLSLPGKPNLPPDVWEAVKQDIFGRFACPQLQPALENSVLLTNEVQTGNAACLTLHLASIWQRRELRTQHLRLIEMALSQRVGRACSVELTYA